MGKYNLTFERSEAGERLYNRIKEEVDSDTTLAESSLTIDVSNPVEMSFVSDDEESDSELKARLLRVVVRCGLTMGPGGRIEPLAAVKGGRPKPIPQ